MRDRQEWCIWNMTKVTPWEEFTRMSTDQEWVYLMINGKWFYAPIKRQMIMLEVYPLMRLTKERTEKEIWNDENGVVEPWGTLFIKNQKKEKYIEPMLIEGIEFKDIFI